MKIFDVGIKSALLCLLLFLLNEMKKFCYIFIGIVLDILATLKAQDTLRVNLKPPLKLPCLKAL